MNKRNETEILDVFIKHIIKQYNAKVYCEVRVAGVGTADVVISFPDGCYWAVEGKATKLSYALLAQCRRWKQLVSKVVAVVPYSSMENEETNLAVTHFEYCSIAVSMVGDGDSVWEPSCTRTGWEGKGIAEALRPSQLYEDGRFAKAGQSSGKRASKKNEAHHVLQAYIKDNPMCSAAECARVGGMKANALLRLIKQGQIIAEVKVEGGKSYLFVK